jgi:hypothetical protein
MWKIKLIFEHIISISKTLWVNFTSLPFKQTVKLPIYVHYNVIFKIKVKLNYYLRTFLDIYYIKYQS